jgi:hypothetical protein
MPYGPRTYRGDPGILGSIWSGVRRIGSSVLRASPVGQAYRYGSSVYSGLRGRPSASSFAAPGGARMGGKPGSKPAGEKMLGKKRRRINPANPKALRRAIRRQEGFVKLARKALKGTGYKISRAGSSRKPVQVRESGAGSVTIH